MQFLRRSSDLLRNSPLLSRRAVIAAVTFGLILPGVLLPMSGHTDNHDPLVDVVVDGKGRINYSEGVIKATGYGAAPALGIAQSPSQAKLMALGAARADALRTLAMTVSSVQVTAETTVKNYVLEKDVVSTQVSALLKSPKFLEEKIQADGTAIVVASLPLYGKKSVAAVVLPEVLKREDTTTTTTVVSSSVEYNRGLGAGADANNSFKGPEKPAVRVSPPLPQRLPRYSAVEPGLTPRSDNGPFTSVILDCRGLGVEAIMSPRIYDTTGREVYGTVRATPEYAIETGIVSYPRSMAYAVQSARAGRHPLIIRALRTADRNRFHPVISLEDADRILAANNRDRFLEQTRVLLLVDPVRY